MLKALLIVALGGTVGTALRIIIAVALGVDAAPLALLAANLGGSLALGLLFGALESWGRRHGPSPRLGELRWLLGTGLLGGFTSYSALSLLVAETLPQHPLFAIGYGLLTVLGGLALAGIGFAAASALSLRGSGADAVASIHKKTPPDTTPAPKETPHP